MKIPGVSSDPAEGSRPRWFTDIGWECCCRRVNAADRVSCSACGMSRKKAMAGMTAEKFGSGFKSEQARLEHVAQNLRITVDEYVWDVLLHPGGYSRRTVRAARKSALGVPEVVPVITNEKEIRMRRTLTAFAVFLALIFVPVLWGLPPPGEQPPAELAWGCCLELNQQLHENVTQEPDPEPTGHL